MTIMRGRSVWAILLAAMLYSATAIAQLPDTGVVMGRLQSPGGTAAAGVRVMAIPVPDSSYANPSEVLEAIAETDASGSYRL